MRRLAPAIAAVFVVIAGCKKKPPPAPAETVVSVDASAPDAAASSKDEIPLTLVAEGIGRVGGTVTSDGHVIFSVGPMLYEGRPDGTLESALTPTELATLIPDDDTVVGYTRTFEITGLGGGTLAEYELQAYGGGGRSENFKRGGGKLTPVRADFDALWYLPYRGHHIAWDMNAGGFRWVDRSDLPVPIVPRGFDVDPGRITTGAGGELIAYPQRIDSAQGLLVWRPDSENAWVVPFPEDSLDCRSLGSATGRYTIRCGTTGYALEGNRWVRVFDHASASTEGETELASDGSLYVAKYPDVMRCSNDGRCTTRKVPDVEGPSTPSYQPSPTEFVSSAKLGGQSWDGLDVHTSLPSDHGGQIMSVMARGPDDVWVVVSRPMRVQIFHTGPARAKPTRLPSPLDARVALRNQRPPSRWTGPCDQIYVRLGSDGDALVKRNEEIFVALGVNKTYGHSDSFSWSLVEGMLGDQRGAGIVLARQSPEAKLAPMEKAVHELVKTFATGPANEPPAYCTLPVLERRLL